MDPSTFHDLATSDMREVRRRLGALRERLANLNESQSDVDHFLEVARQEIALNFAPENQDRFAGSVVLDSGTPATNGPTHFSKVILKRRAMQIAISVGPYPPFSPVARDYVPDHDNCMSEVVAVLSGTAALAASPSGNPAVAQLRASLSLHARNQEKLYPQQAYMPLTPFSTAGLGLVAARVTATLSLSSDRNPKGIRTQATVFDAAQSTASSYVKGRDGGSGTDLTLLANIDAATTHLAVNVGLSAFVLSLPAETNDWFDRGFAQLEFRDKTGIIGPELVKYGYYTPSAEFVVDRIELLVSELQTL